MYQLPLFGITAKSTSSAAASRVKTSARPGEARALRAAARVYGERCSGLSTKSDPTGSSLRTYLLSSCEALTGCSLRWRESATPAGHWWLELGRSAHRIEGTECGSSGVYPTPAATDQEAGSNGSSPSTLRSGHYHGMNLLGSVMTNWPTPDTQNDRDGTKVRESQGRGAKQGINHGLSLHHAIHFFPTPRAEDSEQTGPHGEANDTLTSAVRASWGTPRVADAANVPYQYDRGDHDKPRATLYGQATDWMTPASHEREATPKQGLRGENNPNLAMQASWPTVHGNQGNNGPSGTELGNAVNQEALARPTPTKNANKDCPSEQARHTPPLESAVTIWQTPEACQALGGHRSRGGDRKDELLLGGQAVQESINSTGRGRGSLNSEWVMQLMGWPEGYAAELTRLLSEYAATAGATPSRK